MLHTRCLLLTEHSVIRRCGISKFLGMSTVYTRLRAVPARSSDSFLELTNSTIRIFWEMCKKHCACQLACLCLVPWTSATKGRSVDSSSKLTLVSSGVFSFGSTTGCTTTTLCASGATPEKPSLNRWKPLWNLMRPVSQTCSSFLSHKNRFFRQHGLPVGGRDDGGSFRSSDGIFFTISEFTLAHHEETSNCPQTKIDLHFRNLTELRHLSLDLSLRPEECVTRLNTSRSKCTDLLVHVQCFLRANFLLASKTSARLPNCSHGRAFGLRLLCPLCGRTPRVGPFFSRSFTNRFCDKRQLEFRDNILPNVL